MANKICGGGIKLVANVPKDIGKCGYAPDAGFTFNADKLKALVWRPEYGLDEMYRRILTAGEGDKHGKAIRIPNIPW